MSGLNVSHTKVIKACGESISTGKGTIHQAIKHRDFRQTPAIQAAKALEERPDTKEFNAVDQELTKRCQAESGAVLQLCPDRELDIEPVEPETITHGHYPPWTTNFRVPRASITRPSPTSSPTHTPWWTISRSASVGGILPL